jgi:hypothetical protein
MALTAECRRPEGGASVEAVLQRAWWLCLIFPRFDGHIEEKRRG